MKEKIIKVAITAFLIIMVIVVTSNSIATGESEAIGETKAETVTVIKTAVTEPTAEKDSANTTYAETEITELYIEPTTVIEYSTTETTRNFSIKLSNSKYYDVPISESDQDFIRGVCEYYNIDNKLVYQMMKVESNFNPNCVSKTNDHGIMQINANYYSGYLKLGDDYDSYLTNFNIYDIRQNVIIGVRELSSWKTVCANKGYYDTADMLEAYNRGYGYFSNPNKKNYSTEVLSVVISSK